MTSQRVILLLTCDETERALAVLVGRWLSASAQCWLWFVQHCAAGRRPTRRQSSASWRRC